MRWTGLAAALVAAFALAPMLAPAAHADPYRWCANYYGRNAASNCGFVTRRQCMQTVSGIGGDCEPNPDYDGRPFSDEYSAPRRSYPPYHREYR